MKQNNLLLLVLVFLSACGKGQDNKSIFGLNTGDHTCVSDVHSDTIVSDGFNLTFRDGKGFSAFTSGINSAVVDNPYYTLKKNTSCKVNKFVKKAGAETWGGAAINYRNKSGELMSFDFSNGKVLSFNIYVNQPGIFRIDFEDLPSPNTTATMIQEVIIPPDSINKWLTLSLDFTTEINDAISYKNCLIYWNKGLKGTGEIFYLDNISQGVTMPGVLFDFENLESTPTFAIFGGADLGDSGITLNHIINPVSISGGINTSHKIFQIIQEPGIHSWAGITTTLKGNIDFSRSDTTFEIMIYTNNAAIGSIVKLKLENVTNPAISVELDALTTVQHAWEVLTFNFNNEDMLSDSLGYDVTSNIFNRMTLFFDFQTTETKTNETMFYFDNITFK